MGPGAGPEPTLAWHSQELRHQGTPPRPKEIKAWGDSPLRSEGCPADKTHPTEPCSQQHGQPNATHHWRGAPNTKDLAESDSKRLSAPSAFKQDLNDCTKMPHLGQCGNLHACQHVCSPDVKHNSWSGGCEFDLPNYLFLSLWSHFTWRIRACFELPHVWFLSPQKFSVDVFSILSKSHSSFHLKVLETIHILFSRHSFCKQRECLLGLNIILI